MQAQFGCPVGRVAFPSFNPGDLRVGVSSVTMAGAVPGVLRRVCLRCILGLFLRMHGFVGLVLVVSGVAGAPTPSAVAFSPSEAGNVPPFIIISIVFFQFFDGRLFGLVFQSLDALYSLLCHVFVVLLV